MLIPIFFGGGSSVRQTVHEYGFILIFRLVLYIMKMFSRSISINIYQYLDSFDQKHVTVKSFGYHVETCGNYRVYHDLTI